MHPVQDDNQPRLFIPKQRISITPTSEKPSMIHVGYCTCDSPPNMPEIPHREWCGYEPARWSQNGGEPR